MVDNPVVEFRSKKIQPFEWNYMEIRMYISSFTLGGSYFKLTKETCEVKASRFKDLVRFAS